MKLSVYVFIAPQIRACKLKDPLLDTCIRDSINSVLPALRTKIDKINLPVVEPITYKTVNISYMEIGKFSVKNFKGYGLSRAKVQNVKTTFKNDKDLVYSSDFTIPKLLLSGYYKGFVTFNNFRLAPKGQFNVTLKGVSGKLKVDVGTKRINQDEFLNIETFGITPSVKEAKFALTGVFADANLSE